MNDPLGSRAFQILLVEDNPGDVRLMQEALKEYGVTNDLVVARDGIQALEYLRPLNQRADFRQPDLILLDLNLPKKDGREVLADIKSDSKLCVIPVVVLTTSDTEIDIMNAYQLHANCFITKPIDLEQFISVVKSIEDFWLSVVQLPRKGLA